jgi:catechol 2,3-dioxygenase-like lactoylglutathione lyase family enzyme
MLDQFPVHASLAVSDLQRAKAWYQEKLGLTPKREDPGGLWYECAGPTWFGIYTSEHGDRPPTRSPDGR